MRRDVRASHIPPIKQAFEKLAAILAICVADVLRYLVGLQNQHERHWLANYVAQHIGQ